MVDTSCSQEREKKKKREREKKEKFLDTIFLMPEMKRFLQRELS